MTIAELIDEIAMVIYLGKMLGEDTHTIAEAIYDGYIKKEDTEDEASTEVCQRAR